MIEGPASIVARRRARGQSQRNDLCDAANQLTRKETIGKGWTYHAYDEDGSLIREYDQAAGQLGTSDGG